MNTSATTTTIDLTLPTTNAQTSSPNDNKISSTVKTKIGRHGLEDYYEEFKEYKEGDLKAKTSAMCLLCKELVWHVKNSTSNYSRHLQRKHNAEYKLWSQKISTKEKTENKLKQIFLEDSLSSSAHVPKYGPAHPRQVELTRMVIHDSIIGLVSETGRKYFQVLC